jgi:hypothetical protein
MRLEVQFMTAGRKQQQKERKKNEKGKQRKEKGKGKRRKTRKSKDRKATVGWFINHQLIVTRREDNKSDQYTSRDMEHRAMRMKQIGRCVGGRKVWSVKSKG